MHAHAIHRRDNSGFLRVLYSASFLGGMLFATSVEALPSECIPHSGSTQTSGCYCRARDGGGVIKVDCDWEIAPKPEPKPTPGFVPTKPTGAKVCDKWGNVCKPGAKCLDAHPCPGPTNK